MNEVPQKYKVLVENLKVALDTEQGRAIMKYLEYMYLGEFNTVNPNNLHNLKLAHNEGCRTVVFDLKAKVKAEE